MLKGVGFKLQVRADYKKRKSHSISLIDRESQKSDYAECLNKAQAHENV